MVRKEYDQREVIALLREPTTGGCDIVSVTENVSERGYFTTNNMRMLVEYVYLAQKL